jgi:ABC-type amino acid transport substrate-binding protein
MRSFILAAGLSAWLLSPASAQGPLDPGKPESRLVTVLSDGLSEPAGAANKVLNELSIVLDKESDVRLLAVAGYGGISNVRDLLLLRGTDFAVLNSDILSYPDTATLYSAARRKIRLVAPLVHQRVLLFAKRGINGLDELSGRKIGVPAKLASRQITAKTILALLNIKAKVLETGGKNQAKQPQHLDAVLIYERDLPKLQALGVTSATHHLLPIPASSGPLAGTYVSRKLSGDSLPGYDAGGLETVQVSALLAAFDWSPKQGRYQDAITLADRVYTIAPKFRHHYPASPFSRINLRKPVPGWKYFGPAGVLAKAAPAMPVKEEALLLAREAPVRASQSNALKIVAANRPPLLTPEDKDGGIVMKILTSALSTAGVPISVQWAGSDKAALDELIASKKADIGIFFEAPHCDAPANQSALEAEVCDQLVLTDPLLQAVIAVFAPLDMPLDPRSAGVFPHSQTLCVPYNQTVPAGTLREIPWVKKNAVKIMRPKSLVNCLVALQQHEAGGLIAIEPEVRYAIEKLALAKSFQIAQRPGSTAGLHAAIAKGNPRQAELIKTINEALVKFKASSGYSQVIAAHLADLTGGQAKQP